jgi:hypothetical protein
MIEINNWILTALESLFPPLMGLDNAAWRSSCSSSSKNPCEGPAWRWFDPLFGYLLFDAYERETTALEELVVRLAETAVTDEAVRGNERECLAPAVLETWPNKNVILLFYSCLLTYLTSPVCN